MSYDALEQSQQDSQPVELFEFKRGATFWRYTNYPVTITRFAHAWAARAITRGTATLAGTVPKETIELKLPASDDVLTALLDGSCNSVTSLTVYRTHADEDISRAIWKGRIARVGFSQAIATVTCEPVFTSLNRTGLPQPYQRMCRHVFGGKGCFVNIEALSFPVSVSAVEGSRLSSAGSFPADVLGGTVKSGDGQTRTIIAVDGTQITLMRPILGVGPGSLVTVYPGCDRSMERCQQLGNLGNFGGFPGIPLINPFTVMRSVFT